MTNLISAFRFPFSLHRSSYQLHQVSFNMIFQLGMAEPSEEFQKKVLVDYYLSISLFIHYIVNRYQLMAGLHLKSCSLIVISCSSP